MAFALFRKLNLKILAVGHIISQAYDYGFDYILYPFVIYKLGPLQGGIIMTLVATSMCLLILYIYDLLEKDWLGIEVAKELVENFFKEEEEIAKKSWQKKGKKVLSWVFHKNKIGQFLFLSLHFDPLITAIYMRRGYHLYNGFSKRDWKIFWASVIVSNSWWTLVSFSGVAIFKEFVGKFF